MRHIINGIILLHKCTIILQTHSKSIQLLSLSESTDDTCTPGTGDRQCKDKFWDVFSSQLVE